MNKPSKLKKLLFVILGLIALLLSYIGIIIPGVPAIPFIILAAYFFAHSSPRIYAWMMGNRLIKRLLLKSKKINRRVFKGLLISQVWFSVAVAEIMFTRSDLARVLFAVGGVVLTTLILLLIKTRHAEKLQTR